MKTKHIFLSSLFSLLMGIGILYSSCSDYDYDTDYSWLKNVSSIKIDNAVDGILPLNLNKPGQLALSVDPDQEMNIKSFFLSVSDTSIVSVSAIGELKAKDLGTVTLTVTHRGDSRLTTSCKIQVWSELEEIKQRTDPIIIKIGVASNLYEQLLLVPAKVENGTLTFESLNTDLITIDENGIMTGLAEGFAKIKATAPVNRDGVVISKVVNIEVKDKILVSTIELRSNQGVAITKIAPVVNQEFNIAENLHVGGADADDRTVTYSVDNSAVATIDANGILKIVGAGTAKLTIAANDASGISEVVEINAVAAGAMYDRNFWTVGTSIEYDKGGVITNYVPDGASGKPEHIFDNDAKTFLSLIKPGKSYNGYTTPADHQLTLIIDMKEQLKFNSLIWKNRAGNSYNYLRVWGISMYGSNDNTTFTPIKVGVDLDYTINTDPAAIEIPTSDYRYIKVTLDKWSDNSGGAASGSSIQIGEIALGLK